MLLAFSDYIGTVISRLIKKCVSYIMDMHNMYVCQILYYTGINYPPRAILVAHVTHSN